MTDLKPGRELDALIAEKVMGFTWAQGHTGLCHKYEDLGSANQRLVFAGSIGALPHYSTDIAAAWEVAQKIIDMDDDNEFEIHLSPSKHKECTVSIRYAVDPEKHDGVSLAGPFYVLGVTAPHAICLAALRTLEAK